MFALVIKTELNSSRQVGVRKIRSWNDVEMEANVKRKINRGDDNGQWGRGWKGSRNGVVSVNEEKCRLGNGMGFNNLWNSNTTSSLIKEYLASIERTVGK